MQGMPMKRSGKFQQMEKWSENETNKVRIICTKKFLRTISDREVRRDFFVFFWGVPGYEGQKYETEVRVT